MIIWTKIICLEELKEVLNSGRENEYIKINNISEVECLIKKNFILTIFK